jgi:hypothetical protein
LRAVSIHLPAVIEEFSGLLFHLYNNKKNNMAIDVLINVALRNGLSGLFFQVFINTKNAKKSPITR